MVTDAEQLDAMFREIIAALRAALTDEEAKFGWTERTKAQFLGYYERQLAALRGSGTELDRRGGAARAMDFQGVVGGDLQNLAARVDNMVRATSRG